MKAASGDNPRGFTQAERERFRNLLALAAGSSFEGERSAALAAARRLAARYGMSLEDAARSGREPPAGHAEPFSGSGDCRRAAARARAFRESEDRAERERERFRAAREEAYRRGLDRERERRAERSDYAGPRSRRRREPLRHAAILLRETHLPFREIARITGLGLYEVVGLKLKLRTAA